MLDVPAFSLASQRLQWFLVFVDSAVIYKPCRSWLASEDGVSADSDAGCAGLIAGKPAPTVVFGVR